MGNLFDAVRDCLLCADVEQKLTKTRATAAVFREGRMDMEPFGMPDAFYADWLQVADEEVYHFGLIRTHLQTFGHDYGDFDAHNGLWEMAEKTAGDVLERLAMVPRVLEARGLDVTPGIMAKFRQAGDDEAVSILEIILRDEIGHVEAGTRWFRHVCRQRGLGPERHFFGLLKTHFPAGLKGVLNVGARRQAGFTDYEMKHAQQDMACR